MNKSIASLNYSIPLSYSKSFDALGSKNLSCFFFFYLNLMSQQAFTLSLFLVSQYFKFALSFSGSIFLYCCGGQGRCLVSEGSKTAPSKKEFGLRARETCGCKFINCWLCSLQNPKERKHVNSTLQKKTCGSCQYHTSIKVWNEIL